MENTNLGSKCALRGRTTEMTNIDLCGGFGDSKGDKMMLILAHVTVHVSEFSVVRRTMIGLLLLFYGAGRSRRHLVNHLKRCIVLCVAVHVFKSAIVHPSCRYLHVVDVALFKLQVRTTPLLTSSFSTRRTHINQPHIKSVRLFRKLAMRAIGIALQVTTVRLPVTSPSSSRVCSGEEHNEH